MMIIISNHINIHFRIAIMARLLCLAISLFSLLLTGHHSLSSSSDKVNILASEKLHFVYFYASWCPHCRSFAPVFKQFLAETATWRNLVDISAVPCSDHDRTKWSKECYRYKVNTVPQFRLFWFKPNASDTGISVVPNIYDPTKMCSSVIDVISKHWQRGGVPDFWPHFAPLSHNELTKLVNKDGQSDDAEKTAVIVEEPRSMLGRELMLRLGEACVSGNLAIYRAVYRPWNRRDIEAWRPLLANIGPIQPPFVMLLNRQHGGVHFIDKPKDLHQSDLQYFTAMLHKK